MADYLPVILDYLREHNFTKAEEALVTELQTRQTKLVGASNFSGYDEVENLVDGRQLSDGSLCIDRFKDLSLNLDPPSRKLIDGSSNTDAFREFNSSSNSQLENSRCGSSFKDEFRASDFNSDRQLTKLRDEASFEDSFMALSLNSDAKTTYSRVNSSCENHFRASNSSLDLQTAKLTNGSSYKDEFRGSSLDSNSQLAKLRDASSCLDKFSSLNLSLDILPINLECGPFYEDHFGASNLQLDRQAVKTRHESSLRGDLQSKGGSSYIDNFSYLNLSSEHHQEISRDGSSCEDGSTDLNLHLYPQPPKSRDESLYIDQFRSLSLQPSFETNQSHVSASATRDNLTDGQAGCEPNSVNVSAFREWRRDHDSERMTKNVQNEKEELSGSDTFDNSVFSLRVNQLFEKNPSNLTSRMDEWQNRLQRKHSEDTCRDPRAVQPQACTNIYEINGYGEKESSPNRITHSQPPRYDEAQDANLQSFSRFAYNAPINNGWMDFGFPLSGMLKRPTKSHSNLPPFVTDDGSGVMSRQQDEDDCIDFLKTNKKERENGGDDLVTNLTFPWELGTPNSFGVGEIFSNESQTEKFSSWHPAKFKPTIKDLCLTKEDDHRCELNTVLPGNNQGYANTVFEENYNLGSFLDIPIGQGVALTGDKHDCGINELLPLSQSLMQDSPELLSGFATLGDDPTGSGIEYPKDYWDSDTYDDDEDPGYHRQPIEDEAWFLAHEIEYPSDDDRVTSNNEKEVIYPLQDGPNEIFSNALNIQESYSSRKQMYNTIENVTQTVPNSEVCTVTDLFGNATLKETLKQMNAISYDGQLMDSEDLKLMGIKESLFSGEKKHSESAPQANIKTASISGNFCLNSVKETEKKNLHEPADFSFPSPSSTDIPLSQEIDNYDTGASRLEDSSTWRQEGKVSSSTSSQRNMGCPIVVPSKEATVKVKHKSFVKMDEIRQSDANVKDEESLSGIDDRDNALLQDELEQMKVQEDLEQIKMQEDFEIFTLRIVHRKNRTGFEEEKDFPIVLNSIVAGRYLVTEYLGSAAFSKAVQARDLQTGVDVCMKIVKNNKDFFDQSLDEIKLLKYINKHDPADSHHLLRLYDYFYYREHLFLVCELLRANLYEFQKFNRESGGEIYFTMPRLQSITRQCLEALEFLHGLGLIHCDLKPENILIKSYSRCEIKVIDLGSSCFQTDHLCSYVQSRSYRAPEVILGLPYDQKIDIWSLGCILAELCSGNVLFQNDSLATLLARVVGIIGPIVPDMILKGREAHKYFSKNFMLYDRNQATNMLEYVIPKKTSLRHRIPAGDQGFVDFVAYLLQIHPESRPTASEALKHPWLTYPYDPILT